MAKAESKLKCDVKRFVQAGRMSGVEKDKRDLLLYVIWQAGHLNNEQIGSLFGISYSAVSHIVRTFKNRLKNNPQLKTNLDQLNSLFRL